MNTKDIRNTEIGGLVSYPIQRVHIELTNACNFDCMFCPKSIMTRKVGFMKKELAFNIIDQVAEHNIAEKVTFHIMGEPLLHPDFFEILSHCSKRGVKAGLTTNGSFLNKKNVDRLVEADIHQTSISLQTPDKESFELRKSKNLGYEQYADSVAEYIGKLRKNGKKTIIKIHFLNTKYNKALQKEIGTVDVINSTEALQSVLSEWTEKIYSVQDIDESANKQRVLQGISHVTINRWNVLEIAPNIFFETYVLNSWGNAFSKKNFVNASFGYCNAMKDHFGILFNGDLIYCCKDFDGNTRVGNVNDSPIVDLLNSKSVINMVTGFGRFKVVHTYCQKCLGAKSHTAALLNQVGSIVFMRLFKWYFYNTKKLYS